MITLILPTVDRGDMLRTALQSVAAQTAVKKVSQIFVSENGGGRTSEAVCAEFPQLPITYVYRTPMKPMEHARVMMREFLSGDGLTAILHDDDWWSRHHLAEALEVLETDPDASCYGSGRFEVCRESSVLYCNDNLLPWFGASYPDMQGTWKLSRSNVLMGELLGTMVHYSTLVARTAALRQAAYVYDLNNAFDNDRMVLYALSMHGPVLYNPEPRAYIRNHRAQDTATFTLDAQARHFRQTTRWMVEASGRSWEAIAASFARRISQCPPYAIQSLMAYAMKDWCLPELHRKTGKFAFSVLPKKARRTRADDVTDTLTSTETAELAETADLIAA